MRFFPVLVLGALLVAGPSAKAGIMIGNPGTTKLQGGLVHAQAHVIALKWVARTGRTQVQRLPVVLDPFQPGTLLAPPGEWTDVVLVLDGPVQIDGRSAMGGRFSATFDLGEWTIPLEDPFASEESRPLSLDLSLPDGLSGTILPGQARYAALLAALRDGALAR